jgi:hypothetical protein
MARMRKHLRRAMTICVALAMLLLVLLWRGSTVIRQQYELLPPGIAEAEAEATFGFAGEEVDGPPLPALRVGGVRLKLSEYRWKRWQSSRGAEVRLGFGIDGGLRCKCWIERDPSSSNLWTSTEVEYADDGARSYEVCWVDEGSWLDRLLASLYCILP